MRYVAPRVQGRSISSMLDEQLAVVKQQRAAMAEARRVQEAENRKFQYKQMENIYDFKLEGWNADAIADFQRLQQDAANKLSTGQIRSMQELIDLKNSLVAVHNLYNQDGKISTEGREAYQGYIDDPSSYKSDDNEFVGNKEDFQGRIDYSNKLRFINVDERGNGDYMALNGVTLDQAIRQQNQGVEFQTTVLEDGSKVLINMSTNEQTVVRGQLQNHPHLADRNIFTPPAILIGNISPHDYLYDSSRKGKNGNYYELKLSANSAKLDLQNDIVNAQNSNNPLKPDEIEERVAALKNNYAEKILIRLRQQNLINGLEVDNPFYDSLAFNNAVNYWETITGMKWADTQREKTISSRAGNPPIDIFNVSPDELLPEELYARDGVETLNLTPKTSKPTSTQTGGATKAQEKAYAEILQLTTLETDTNTVPNPKLNNVQLMQNKANSDILNGLADMYQLNMTVNNNPVTDINGLLSQNEDKSGSLITDDTKGKILERYNEEIARAYPGLAEQLEKIEGLNLSERISVSIPTQNATFSIEIPQGHGALTGPQNFKSFDYYVGDDAVEGGGNDVLVLHLDQGEAYQWSIRSNNVIEGESNVIIVTEGDQDFKDIKKALRGELNANHGGYKGQSGYEDVLSRLIKEKFS